MNFRLIGIIAVVAIVGGLATWFYFLNKDNFKLTNNLRDTTAALQSSRVRVGRLVTDSTTNVAVIATKDKTIADQKTANAEMLTKAAEAQLSAVTSEQRYKVAVNGLTAMQKKQAADRLVGGVGPVPTTVKDEEANGDFTNLKWQVVNYRDSVVPALTREVAYHKKRADDSTASAVRLRRQLADEKANGQDLVAELNGDIAFVQEKRATASKGLGILFKRGQIKGYGEIDAKLRDTQKRVQGKLARKASN